MFSEFDRTSPLGFNSCHQKLVYLWNEVVRNAYMARILSWNRPLITNRRRTWRIEIQMVDQNRADREQDATRMRWFHGTWLLWDELRVRTSSFSKDTYYWTFHRESPIYPGCLRIATSWWGNANSQGFQTARMTKGFPMRVLYSQSVMQGPFWCDR